MADRGETFRIHANQNYTHHDNDMTPNPMTLDLWRVSRDHGMAESRFCVLAHIIDAFSDYLCLKKKNAPACGMIVIPCLMVGVRVALGSDGQGY